MSEEEIRQFMEQRAQKYVSQEENDAKYLGTLLFNKIFHSIGIRSWSGLS